MWELGNGSRQRAPSKRAHHRFGLASAESVRVQLPPRATPYPKLHTKMSACCSARMLCLPVRPRLFSALLHREGLQSAVIPSFGRRARQPAQHTSPVFALSLTQSPSPCTSSLFELSQRLLPYCPYRCCTVNPLPVYDRHVFLCGLNYAVAQDSAFSPSALGPPLLHQLSGRYPLDALTAVGLFHFASRSLPPMLRMHPMQ